MMTTHHKAPLQRVTPVEIERLAPERRSARRHSARVLGDAVLRLRNLEEGVRDLQKKLFTDTLTGLANANALREVLPAQIEEAKQSGQPLAVLMADVDGLKRTNDKYGHVKGDELLRVAGQSLSAAVRPEDLVGRNGGDEFFAVLPGFIPQEGQETEELFESVKARIKQHFASDSLAAGFELELKVGVSVGIALLEPGDTAETLLGRADAMMYADKAASYQEHREQGVVFHDSRTA